MKILKAYKKKGILKKLPKVNNQMLKAYHTSLLDKIPA